MAQLPASTAQASARDTWLRRRDSGSFKLLDRLRWSWSVRAAHFADPGGGCLPYMATVLAEKSNASGTLWYSQHSLTAYSGLSTRTVGQHLATLVARGYLQVLSIGVRTEHWRSIKYTPTKAVNSQTYRLHIPEGAFTLSEPRLSR